MRMTYISGDPPSEKIFISNGIPEVLEYELVAALILLISVDGQIPAFIKRKFYFQLLKSFRGES